jgi:hypothetical protein
MKFYHTIICFLVLSLFAISANAQSSISLSTGISTDINNTNSFYQIPFTLIWKPFRNIKSPVFFEFDYDLPLGSNSTGDAYTLNPGLPQKVTLKEKILPYVFTASLGFRIHLFTTKKNNAFYLNVVPLAICQQNIKVSYKKFDKVNYEVLNPDVNSNEGGLVMSMAPIYYFHKTKRDMMLMLHLQTPLLKRNRDYELSYKYMAPMQLTFGYNFYYNRK